jgi:hypothetical protein
MTVYIEHDCTISHEDHNYTAGGAYVSDDYCIAYPGKGSVLYNWHGEPIGTYRVLSTRLAIFFGYHSWQGNRYYYMHGTIDGKTYSLRGFGPGTVAKGKRIKG